MKILRKGQEQVVHVHVAELKVERDNAPHGQRVTGQAQRNQLLHRS
jgi:hypothetical protein